MASRLTAITSFPRVFFSTPVIFKATFKLFGSQGCSNDKNLLDFSSRFLNFAVQFYFRKFSFHEKGRLSKVSQWRDFPRPIAILCYAQ